MAFSTYKRDIGEYVMPESLKIWWRRFRWRYLHTI